MPQTFGDLLIMEGVQTPLREPLLQPLSVPLTPLCTPKIESGVVSKPSLVESDVEPDEEPVLELHPSNASLYVEPVKESYLTTIERLTDNLPHATSVIRRRKKENTEPNSKNSPEFSQPLTIKAKEVKIDQSVKSEVHSVSKQRSKHMSDDRKAIHSPKLSPTRAKRERERNPGTIDGRATKKVYRSHYTKDNRDERDQLYHRAQLPPPSYFLPPPPKFRQYQPW